MISNGFLKMLVKNKYCLKYRVTFEMTLDNDVK